MIYTFKTNAGVYTICECMNTEAEARQHLAHILWKEAGYSEWATGSMESWVLLAKAIGV